MTTDSPAPLANKYAAELIHVLTNRKAGIVFAESCTAGLAVNLCSRFPGTSAVLCGSFVVYQIESKQEWLGLSRESLSRDDAVTEEVARQLASNALDRTPRATYAASITGHLGPNAPDQLDGTAWISFAVRRQSEPVTEQLILSKTLPPDSVHSSLRDHRQWEAAGRLLGFCLRQITE